MKTPKSIETGYVPEDTLNISLSYLPRYFMLDIYQSYSSFLSNL